MKGGEVVQETRFFNVDEGITYSMRGKEEAHDYRYFPEPDLLPLKVDNQWIEEVRQTVPELPSEKMDRFLDVYGLPKYDVEILVSDKALADYFEEATTLFPEPKTISNWVMTELLRELKDGNVSPKDSPLPPKHLAELLSLIKDGTIHIKMGKEIFPDLYKTGVSPKQLVKEKGLVQISDETAIISTINGIIARFPKEVEEFRAGKDKLIGFFVGQAMKETKGKANPKLLNELLLKKLKGE
jgi:aspartyl-tRNA(Asn)/glutamyl-tRNA(Gln) amidotransferase subunit B